MTRQRSRRYYGQSSLVTALPALMLLVHGPEDLTLYAVLVVAFTFGTVAFNFFYLARRRILRNALILKGLSLRTT